MIITFCLESKEESKRIFYSDQNLVNIEEEKIPDKKEEKEENEESKGTIQQIYLFIIIYFFLYSSLMIVLTVKAYTPT